jgi:hypothetical protein
MHHNCNAARKLNRILLGQKSPLRKGDGHLGKKEVTVRKVYIFKTQ